MWAAAGTHRWLLLGSACLALALVVAVPMLARTLRPHVSMKAMHMHPFNSRGNSSGSGSSSGSGKVSGDSQAACAYGQLPGTWVDGAAAGGHWHLLSPTCQLSNLLEKYTAAAAAKVGWSPTAAASDAASKTEGGQQQQQEQVPSLRILLLSDSVDRFILQHWCGHMGGIKQTEVMKEAPADIQVTSPDQVDLASDNQPSAPEQLQKQKSRPLLLNGAKGARQEQLQQPSALNKTAYAFHTCHVPGLPSFRLAASYFPGVHPSGPYHRNLQQTYRQRIDAVQAMWQHYASGDPPDLVSVASLLWDIARMRLHEPHRVAGGQLAPQLLEEWVANFTAVVEYARQAFPETKLWVTHTSLPPRHDPVSGFMAKPYLGRRYYTSQLNAAARAAAGQLGLQLVDYRKVGDRFMDGQSYLDDLIHPNELVGLELANIYLNLAHQQLAAEGRLGGTWREAAASGRDGSGDSRSSMASSRGSQDGSSSSSSSNDEAAESIAPSTGTAQQDAVDKDIVSSASDVDAKQPASAADNTDQQVPAASGGIAAAVAGAVGATPEHPKKGAVAGQDSNSSSTGGGDGTGAQSVAVAGHRLRSMQWRQHR